MSRCRKILIVIGVVFAVAILIPVIRHYQLRFAVESYVAQLKAKGEPMDLAQVIPPPVPPEQNSADIFRSAAELIRADKSLLETNSYSAMKMVAPGKAMICWQQSDALGYDATNSWAALNSEVAQNNEVFGLLQQVIDKPEFDFQIRYERGFDGLDLTNFYVDQSKKSAYWLEAAALCNLHSGNIDSAVINLRAMLALVKAMHDERFDISQLVRMAVANIAVTVNWEIIQAPNLTDEQLTELQRDWTGLGFIRSYETVLAMERVTKQVSAERWRRSNSELENNLENWMFLWARWVETETQLRPISTSEKLIITIDTFMWRYWWSYSDELRMLKGYQILLETTRAANLKQPLLPILKDQREKLEKSGVNKFGNYWDVWAEIIDHDFDVHRMLSGGMMGLTSAFHKVMTTETAKELTITAIALKRYQLKHGDYPPDLNSLVPEFVSAVPLDPVDGQPLRYRRNADGTFLLYSVGENGVDDGGDPAIEKGVTGSNFYWQNPHALDWVWPQPATAAEIQNYYEELAKKAAN